MLRSFADGAIFGEATGAWPPRVVALHGWRRDRRDFADVLAGLDALAVDLPGFGATPPPPEPWGADGYATALLPVLTPLEAPPVLVGHSLGGRVALAAAAAYPERVGALVLVGVPDLVPRPGRARPSRRFRAARWLHRRGLLSDARMEDLRGRAGSEDYRAASGVLRDVLVRLVNESYEAHLARVRCPVELVWGARDTAAPVDGARAAHELLADSHLTILDGIGHLVPTEAPRAVRAAIDRRLAALA